MAHSCRDHFLKKLLRHGKLVLVMRGPILKNNHRARVVVVLNIDYFKSYHKVVFIEQHFIHILALNLLVLFLWVYDVIESTLLAVNESIFNTHRLTLLDRIQKWFLIPAIRVCFLLILKILRLLNWHDDFLVQNILHVIQI